MSTSLLEVSLLGVGTMLRLERDAWSIVKRLRQATHEYLPPPPTSGFLLVAPDTHHADWRGRLCFDFPHSAVPNFVFLKHRRVRTDPRVSSQAQL